MDEKMTILLAANDDEDVLLLHRAFTEAGWHVHYQAVQDGEAVAAYLDGKGPYANRNLYPFPAMVVMDMEMPGKNGFEILVWTRAQENLRRLPIVILGSPANGPQLGCGYELGTNSYLVKMEQFKPLLERMKLLEYWATHPGSGLRPEIRRNV